ncbi:hypothetical protein ACP6NA_14290, partial [Corynebacterium striatum]
MIDGTTYPETRYQLRGLPVPTTTNRHNAACRNDYSASFYRTDMLATQLAVLQPDDPTRLKFIEQLHNV